MDVFKNIVAPFSHLRSEGERDGDHESVKKRRNERDQEKDDEKDQEKDEDDDEDRSQHRRHEDSDSSSGQSFSSPKTRSPSPHAAIALKDRISSSLAALPIRISHRNLPNPDPQSLQSSPTSKDASSNETETKQRPVPLLRRNTGLQNAESRRSSTISLAQSERRTSVVFPERRGSVAMPPSERRPTMTGKPGERRKSTAINNALSTMRLYSGHRRKSNVSGGTSISDRDLFDFSENLEVNIFSDMENQEDAAEIPSIRMLIMGETRYASDMAKYLEGYNKHVYEKFGAGLVQFEAVFCSKPSDAISLVEKDERGFDVVICEFTFELMIQPDFGSFLKSVQEDHAIPLIMTSLSGVFSKKTDKSRNKKKPGIAHFVTSLVFPLFHAAYLTELDDKLQKANDTIAKNNQEKMSLRWKLILLDSERKKNIALQNKLRELSTQGNISGLQQIVNNLDRPKDEALRALEESLSPSTRLIIKGPKHNPKSFNYLRLASTDYQALKAVSEGPDITPTSPIVPLSIIQDQARDWPSILIHTRSLLLENPKNENSIPTEGFGPTVTAHSMLSDDLYLLSATDNPWIKQNTTHSRLILASLWNALHHPEVHMPLFPEPQSIAQRANFVIGRDWIARHFSILRDHQLPKAAIQLPQFPTQKTEEEDEQNEEEDENARKIESLQTSLIEKSWEKDVLGADMSQLTDLAVAAFGVLGMYDDCQEHEFVVKRASLQAFFEQRFTFNDSMVENNPQLYIVQHISQKRVGPDKPFLLRSIVYTLLNATYLLNECSLREALHLDPIDVIALLLTCSSHRMTFGEPEKNVLKDSQADYRFSTMRSLYYEVEMSIEMLRKGPSFLKNDQMQGLIFCRMVQIMNALDPKNIWKVISNLQSQLSLKQGFANFQPPSKEALLQCLVLLSQWWYVCSDDASVWAERVQDFIEKEGDMERMMGLDPPEYMDRMHWINIGPSYHLFVAEHIVGPILSLLRQYFEIMEQDTKTIDILLDSTRRNVDAWTQQITRAPQIKQDEIHSLSIPADVYDLCFPSRKPQQQTKDKDVVSSPTTKQSRSFLEHQREILH
eukprot:TRINITY_DN3232_c0_g1_i12.p1 TRINITY_DN3232_c0_g1~~TRINITY_DN3232_c0_g1_i12.p1  ORF type:complete len:1067 (-),score=225.84 TRINITY_DN3232_c0_g1_i12:372-3572(-)